MSVRLRKEAILIRREGKCWQTLRHKHQTFDEGEINRMCWLHLPLTFPFKSQRRKSLECHKLSELPLPEHVLPIFTHVSVYVPLSSRFTSRPLLIDHHQLIFSTVRRVYFMSLKLELIWKLNHFRNVFMQKTTDILRRTFFHAVWFAKLWLPNE